MKAGFSRVDITPPLGLPISGYFRKRPAAGVLDPLEINAIAVSDGDSTAVIMAADIAIISRDRCEIIRERIAKSCGLPKENIFVAALHQHTSLRISFAHLMPDMMSDFDSFDDDNYIEMLYRRFCDAAQMAIDDMKAATLSVGIRETAEPISFIRRYFMKDGSIVTNPGLYDPSEIDRPNGTSDNNVRLIKFSREGAKDIALINFSTHPDVVSGDKYSADWCGFARRFVEADIENTHCMLLVGAQGDTNHLDFIGGRRTGYDHSRFMGRQIADAVIAMWNETEAVAGDGLEAKNEIVQLKTVDIDEAKILEAEAYCAEYEAGKINIREHLAEVAEAKRIYHSRSTPKYKAVTMSLINIGGASIVGFGGEPFTEYAEKVRNMAPDRFVINVCCANGSVNYFPTAKAYEEGGYEAKSSDFLPTLEAQLLGAVKKLFDKE